VKSGAGTSIPSMTVTPRPPTPPVS
jgi:hypothetical protein